MTKKQIFWIGVGVIVIFLIASAAIAYATNWKDPVSKSFKKLYPAAIVGSKPISIEDADEFVNLARNMDASVSAATVYQTYLTHQKSEALLRKLGLKLSSDAVSDELNFYTQGSPETFDQLINDYFGGEKKVFTSNVVYPEVVEANLRIKYNSDYNLNSAAYQKAESVLGQLNQGKSFEDLAKTYSDDKQSAQFGGDMGFFAHGQILPELEKEIAVAKLNEVHDIIVTREGYEIVFPMEVSMVDGHLPAGRQEKTWHAKHILIQTSGFDQWLTNQLKTISVKTLKTY